jgi:hypothetical protein
MTAPAACAGVVTRRLVVELDVMVALDPPISTLTPLPNPAPLIVSAVPPAAGPDRGVIPVTIGVFVVFNVVTVVEADAE